jgi:hypothetical protein
MADQDPRKSQTHDSEKLDDPNHKTVNQEQPPDQPSHMNQGKWPVAPRTEDDPAKKKSTA